MYRDTAQRQTRGLPLISWLGAAFLLLILLLVSIGWLALNRMEHINSSMENLVTRYWKKVQLANKALAFSTSNNRITLQVFLTTNQDDIATLLRQQSTNSHSIRRLLDLIASQAENERETALLRGIKEARTPYVESYRKALKLHLQEGRKEEARLMIEQATLPLLLDYHATWRAFVQFEGMQMDLAASKAQATYLSTRQRTLELLLLAVLLALGIMVTVTRKVAHQAAEREQLNSELEARVHQRTLQLRKANDAMRKKIMAIKRAEQERLKAQKERDLAEVQLQQAQKLEAVGRLAAGIAHEINTPTQYVGDNTRFLQQSFGSMKQVMDVHDALRRAALRNHLEPGLLAEADKAAQSNDLDYLYEQIPAAIHETLEGVGRISKIVQAMKEFSHPGGKEKAPTDLNRAIQTTVTVSHSEWKYVADVNLDLDPKLPSIPCFAGEFSQAILNLIVNAAHAIGDVVKEQNGTKGVITISSRLDGDQIEVRVADTGTGIPAKYHPHIFEPFFTTKEPGKGTGQGLSMVYACIVKRHGGTARFETEAGKGTTFILRLPLVQQSV